MFRTNFFETIYCYFKTLENMLCKESAAGSDSLTSEITLSFKLNLKESDEWLLKPSKTGNDLNGTVAGDFRESCAGSVLVSKSFEVSRLFVFFTDTGDEPVTAGDLLGSPGKIDFVGDRTVPCASSGPFWWGKSVAGSVFSSKLKTKSHF